MSRKEPNRKPQPPVDDISDTRGFQSLINAHTSHLRVHNYSEQTIGNRDKYIRRFALWCLERGITRPTEITKPILERFQRHLYNYRTEKDGKPISFRSQYSHLSSIRAWFKWLAKHNYTLFNPASELEMPKIGHRLPKAVLNQQEAEAVLAVPNITDPCGLRDRAILETFYSSGIRRKELALLKLEDVDFDRRTMFIREGKGNKDRVVPIGQRALNWISVYIESARNELLVDPNERTLFITNAGQPLEPDSLTEYVRHYIDQSGIGKKGSCHLFRHTMATLMHENGADIRFIQAMLGHAKLTTTEIYTQVSIRKLQQIHDLTHPGNRPEAGGERLEEEQSQEQPNNSSAAPPPKRPQVPPTQPDES
jgi:integrase/recombinase XerD